MLEQLGQWTWLEKLWFYGLSRAPPVNLHIEEVMVCLMSLSPTTSYWFLPQLIHLLIYTSQSNKILGPL
uniref:Uncharacterized protein n=1 Tax=Aegilops tauschii subsp. strangulata TaxID=200361 RepID=A0A453CL97_AEGTS